MAKERLIVNGYPIPGGYSGVAVRAACELIISRPGCTQKEVLEHAVKVSGLNLSTAGWITSPGPKSPATLLWDRRKEGVFRCYRNEFTDRVVGSQDAIFQELTRWANDICKRSKYIPSVGELVQISTSIGYPITEGMVLGFAIIDRSTTSSIQQSPSTPLRSSPAEVLADRPEVTCYDKIEAVIMENGTGRQRTTALGWEYRTL